ncbi:DUF1985 domain-containing protein [Abeliophyllum distichum]|uniref:DUF1985 domain-containing protein n=1 Tax=Abeliophyllum distichum TaxID=126358 RepID=A0ABD1Q518_9LAMI
MFLNVRDVNNQDVVNVGILYLITSFLFTTSYKKFVDDSLIILINSDNMESFVWGEFCKITISLLKDVLRNKSLIQEWRKGSDAYSLNGFPLALQVWIYETIPSLDRKICTKWNAALDIELEV